MNTKELVIQLSPELTKAEIADVLDISRQRVQLVLGTFDGGRKASDLYKDLVESGAWEKLNDLRAWLGTLGDPSLAGAITEAVNDLYRVMQEYQAVKE